MGSRVQGAVVDACFCICVFLLILVVCFLPLSESRPETIHIYSQIKAHILEHLV
jgi:hypothetical protein